VTRKVGWANLLIHRGRISGKGRPISYLEKLVRKGLARAKKGWYVPNLRYLPLVEKFLTGLLGKVGRNHFPDKSAGIS